MVRITAMCCACCSLDKWIHFIGTRCEPYAPWFNSKILVCGIEILPLLGIGWMSKFSIVFALIRSMSAHKFCILMVCEQTSNQSTTGRYYITKAGILLCAQ
jgi:hypothetical protein